MDELFEKYSNAFDTFDSAAIASLYTIPCSTSDVDGAKVFSSKGDLLDKFEKNCLSMKTMGYQSSSFNILNEICMGENSKAINIGWLIKFEKSEIEFRSLYICHKIDSQWYIFSGNVYEGSFLNET